MIGEGLTPVSTRAIFGPSANPLTEPIDMAAFSPSALRPELAALLKPAAPKPAPAPATEPKPDWSELDTTTLSPDLQSAYYQYRQALSTASTLRKTFETAMSAKVELPPHLRLIFGYNFGKLSVAIVPADQPRRSGARPALSLLDLVSRA